MDLSNKFLETVEPAELIIDGNILIYHRLISLFSMLNNVLCNEPSGHYPNN